MFIKIINEESQEVYINLDNVEYISKGNFCTSQPIIFFSGTAERMFYWVFQDEKSRDAAFEYMFKQKPLYKTGGGFMEPIGVMPL